MPVSRSCFCIGPPGNCPCMQAQPYFIPNTIPEKSIYTEDIYKLEWPTVTQVDFEFESGFFAQPIYDINGALIEKGVVARNSLGLLGIITSSSPEEFEYPDGNVAKTWKGIHLRHGVFIDRDNPNKLVNVESGGIWTAKNPVVDTILTELLQVDVEDARGVEISTDKLMIIKVDRSRLRDE